MPIIVEHIWAYFLERVGLNDDQTKNVCFTDYIARWSNLKLQIWKENNPWQNHFEFLKCLTEIGVQICFPKTEKCYHEYRQFVNSLKYFSLIFILIFNLIIS